MPLCSTASWAGRSGSVMTMCILSIWLPATAAASMSLSV
jgi:hypothetical protein